MNMPINPPCRIMNDSINSTHKSMGKPMGKSTEQSIGTIDRLRHQIEHLQQTSNASQQPYISTGNELLDRLLPDRGYRPGTLVEFVYGEPGDAALWMSLQLLTQTMKRGGTVVLVDSMGDLYPPALIALGIPLERMILVRNRKDGPKPLASNDNLWAIYQALSSRAVVAVWGVVSTTDGRWLRRLQLAAETGGTLGVLLRPPSVLSYPTWSDIQWHVLPPARKEDEPRSNWRFRLQLTRARVGTGQEVELEMVGGGLTHGC